MNDALAVQVCDLVVRNSTGHEASPKFDPLIIRAKLLILVEVVCIAELFDRGNDRSVIYSSGSRP